MLAGQTRDKQVQHSPRFRSLFGNSRRPQRPEYHNESRGMGARYRSSMAVLDVS